MFYEKSSRVFHDQESVVDKERPGCPVVSMTTAMTTAQYIFLYSLTEDITKCEFVWYVKKILLNSLQNVYFKFFVFSKSDRMTPVCNSFIK